MQVGRWRVCSKYLLLVIVVSFTIYRYFILRVCQSPNVQTPLNNIEPGSFVIVELLRKSTAAAAAAALLGISTSDDDAQGESVGWLRVNIDSSTINSEIASYSFQPSPVMLVDETVIDASGAGPNAIISTMQIEMVVSRVLRTDYREIEVKQR